jgi:hypothetical protein
VGGQNIISGAVENIELPSWIGGVAAFRRRGGRVFGPKLIESCLTPKLPILCCDRRLSENAKLLLLLSLARRENGETVLETILLMF